MDVGADIRIRCKTKLCSNYLKNASRFKIGHTARCNIDQETTIEVTARRRGRQKVSARCDNLEHSRATSAGVVRLNLCSHTYILIVSRFMFAKYIY